MPHAALALCLAAGLVVARQDPPAAAAASEIEQLVVELVRGEATRAESARAELIRRADGAIPLLVERAREHAKAVERDNAAELIAILGVLAQLAPTREDLWPTLVQIATDLTSGGPGWNQYCEDEPEACAATWGRIQDAVQRSLGATGPRNLVALATRLAESPAPQQWTAARPLYRFRPLEEDLQGVLDALRSADDRAAPWIAWSLSSTRESGADLVASELASGDRARVFVALRAARSFTPEREMLVPLVAPFLDHEDAELRYWACFALGSMAPTSLPALYAASANADARVRRCAVEAIEKCIYAHWIERNSPEYSGYGAWHGLSPAMRLRQEAQASLEADGVAALVARLADPDEEIRMLAVFGLYKLGPRASAARPALESARTDASALVRTWVERTLEGMAITPWRRLEILDRLLRGARMPTSPDYDRALEQIASKTENLDRFRLDSAKWNDSRWNATRALASESLPILLRDAAGSDPVAAPRALELLRGMENSIDDHIVSQLVFLDEEWGEGGTAARELVWLGPLALAEVGHDLLRYPRFPMGPPTYAEVSWVLEQQGAAALPVLTEGLEHWNEHGRGWSAQALFKLDAAALPALPLVISAWRAGGNDPRLPGVDAWWDEDGGRFSDWYAGAAWEPGTMGPSAVARMGSGAVPWLVRALDDEHAVVRARAAAALAALGPEAATAAPVLADRLGDPQPFVARAAARALLAIAPAHESATSARAILDG